jgi:RNA polymerase sigma-70 factor (ECF subfamily)
MRKAMGEFERFYRSHVRLVQALALSRTGEAGAAEDVTQETFLRAWRNFGEVGPLPPPAQRAWLLRTARNLAIDRWRRQQRESQAIPDPQPEAWPAELQMDVAAALAELAEGDRELVMMRYVEEMNSREIGEVLGVPEGTVRRRLSRCREVLAARLSQWDPAGGAA